jgi:hypothetical protein
MRLTIMAGALVFLGIANFLACGRAPSANEHAPASPPQSGVYGFSGARFADGEPQGVIGECIWIYDSEDKQQVAKGDCYQDKPGSFRVVLKPGRYVVHGPGGNKPIEVKASAWVRIESIVPLPLAP